MMDATKLYDDTANELSRTLTLRYSTSFGWSTRLIAPAIRGDIFAIYGLVRIADEIVDTYMGADARQLLDALEHETYAAIKRRYSVNPIVHAFQLTANRYGLGRALIEPFFSSMRTDIAPPTYFSESAYTHYIYGSAEVVGLMCLRVFVNGDESEYEKLKQGAARLGAAYQKVNFLRDFAADTKMLGRTYFPNVRGVKLTDVARDEIIADIAQDFDEAKSYINALPRTCRLAVATSYEYYGALLDKLKKTPADTISLQRVRISNIHKLWVTGYAIAAYPFSSRNKGAK